MAVYKGEERNWRFRLVFGPNADVRRCRFLQACLQELPE